MRIQILAINIFLINSTTQIQAWPPGSGNGGTTYVTRWEGGGTNGTSGYPTPYITNYHSSAIKEFFFIKNMVEQETINQDIANIMLSSILLLKIKNFKTKFPPKALKSWNDFSIPIQYTCMLTSKQLCALEHVLLNEKPLIKYPHYIRYNLPNKQTYKWFITIPISLRKHLLELPQSQKHMDEADNNMHFYQTIFITSKNTSKFIIPEEHKKKKKYKSLKALFSLTYDK